MDRLIELYSNRFKKKSPQKGDFFYEPIYRNNYLRPEDLLELLSFRLLLFDDEVPLLLVDEPELDRTVELSLLLRDEPDLAAELSLLFRAVLEFVLVVVDFLSLEVVRC